jgi:hypothetical protein
MDWDCELFGKVPRVRSGIVVGLERCPVYRLGLWKVMLESAKDQFKRVDALGQQVPPRVRYGTTCLLIKNIVRSMTCSSSKPL